MELDVMMKTSNSNLRLMTTHIADRDFKDTFTIKEEHFIRDLDGNFTYTNDYFREMLKLFYPEKHVPRRPLEGQNMDDILTPEKLAYIKDFDRKIIETASEHRYMATYKFKHHTVKYIIIGYPVYQDNRIKEISIIGRYLNLFKINNDIIILSDRELDVLAHITFGYPAKHIAAQLNISTSTVNTHINRIREKLNIKHQCELINLLKEHAIGQHMLNYLKLYVQAN